MRVADCILAAAGAGSTAAADLERRWGEVATRARLARDVASLRAAVELAQELAPLSEREGATLRAAAERALRSASFLTEEAEAGVPGAADLARQYIGEAEAALVAGEKLVYAWAQAQVALASSLVDLYRASNATERAALDRQREQLTQAKAALDAERGLLVDTVRALFGDSAADAVGDTVAKAAGVAKRVGQLGLVLLAAGVLVPVGLWALGRATR